MTIETVTAWLAENPDWHGPIRALWTFLVAHVISYIWMSLFVIYMNRGEPRDKWLWERNVVRHVCAWPLYLATWPLRALWRLWRGRKARRESATTLTLSRAYDGPGQYSVTTRPTGDDVVVIHSDHIVDANKMVPYGSKPDESKRPVTREEFEAVVKAIGLKLGKDSMGVCAYSREATLVEEPITTRLAALEAKDAPKASPFSLGGIGMGSLAGLSRMGFTEAQWNQGPKVAPPASEPEVRVFESIYGARVFAGDCGYLRCHNGDWINTSVVSLTDAERWCRTISGPEKDAIVAAWRAWRDGQ